MQPPPGIARSDAQGAALAAALDAMPDDYRPRTHNWTDGHPTYVNRLIHEGSPYLLQHAHNPVDWWPWGEDALAEARARDVPVFLSAGYATCHWCHVMEDESFDDPQVAAVLNAHFVPVKLDREARPDIDHIYILATTLQHRHAGWPNSVWMMPDGRPFHTGTYFRKDQFIEILQAIANAWAGPQRADLVDFAGQLADGVRAAGRQGSPGAATDGLPEAALAHLGRLYNGLNGGFSGGTQFPHEGYVLFLLDHWRRTGTDRALEMALRTLDEMVAGGLHDQIGGGFHRYTVDVNWRTPHFEKMLYNQALMLQCLTEAWQIGGDPTHARAADRCIAYVLREMTAPDGAFYTAEDADSLDADGAREEGAFYCWSPEALRAVLGDDAGFVIETLGLAEPPTLEAGAVPHLRPFATVDHDRLDPLLERLRVAREDRARPLRDDKVIGGWNGLMIRALADAGTAFGRADWVDAAERALTAVLARLETGDGLARLHARGRVAEAANLTDHAWLANACVSLADAGRAEFLDRAEALADAMLARFDAGDGRLALVRDGTPLGPVLEMEDGAVPSGESSALEVLARLDLRRPAPLRRARATALSRALMGTAAEMPLVRLEGLRAARMLEAGESGYLRSAGDGTVRLTLRRDGTGWRLVVETAPGWHLAGAALPDRRPLALRGAAADLPPVAQHAPVIDVALEAPASVVEVDLQPCSDSACLAPQTHSFRLRP